MVRNARSNQTIRVRFRYQPDVPDPGLRMRAMTITTNRGGDYRFTVRTTANASAGVRRFAGPAPFGYFNVTHAFPNGNVSNASLTFALDRTRLRERNVPAGNVSLYRYHGENRTWDRLPTRATERNATHVTFRAESPGLSEFAVAPTTVESTATPTPTATASPTPTPTPSPTATPTEGGGPGFGPVVALLALLVVAGRVWWG
jgi:PGF-pre-PGF domain-containing protein/PGF-CTERM protein